MMLDMLSTAIVQLDNEGRVDDMNSAAEQFLATGRERARGGHFKDIAGVPEELSEAIATTADDQASRHLSECQFAEGCFDCNIQSIPGHRVLLEFHDLKWQQQQSKWKQLEIQAGVMDLLRRNLGHEIRNPLGGIRGAAQLMAEEPDGGELFTLAQLIIREVDRIDELLERFGQPELHRRPVDIHQVLQETVELLQAEAGDRLEIIHDYDPSIPPLLADASALRQIFLNLVRNAYQADAHRITLRSRVDHDSTLLQPGVRSIVRLDIEDDGRGVPESLRGLLFLPMVTGRRDGTGLGLALAQQIATAHEGMLSYAALESGSRFTLKVPLEHSSG
jgi:two-component system nitrogen regulation sensor histidine kinase GlnL